MEKCTHRFYSYLIILLSCMLLSGSARSMDIPLLGKLLGRAISARADSSYEEQGEKCFICSRKINQEEGECTYDGKDYFHKNCLIDWWNTRNKQSQLITNEVSQNIMLHLSSMYKNVFTKALLCKGALAGIYAYLLLKQTISEPVPFNLLRLCSFNYESSYNGQPTRIQFSTSNERNMKQFAASHLSIGTLSMLCGSPFIHLVRPFVAAGVKRCGDALINKAVPELENKIPAFNYKKIHVYDKEAKRRSMLLAVGAVAGLGLGLGLEYGLERILGSSSV